MMNQPLFNGAWSFPEFRGLGVWKEKLWVYFEFSSTPKLVDIMMQGRGPCCVSHRVRHFMKGERGSHAMPDDAMGPHIDIRFVACEVELNDTHWKASNVPKPWWTNLYTTRRISGLSTYLHRMRSQRSSESTRFTISSKHFGDLLELVNLMLEEDLHTPNANCSNITHKR